MNWKKAISFGVLLWILMFVIVSVFIAFDIYKFNFVEIAAAFIAGAISFLLARKIKPETIKLSLVYGIIWVLTGLILDILVTAKFNPIIFKSWSLWLGYFLVLLAPLILWIILKYWKLSPKQEQEGRL